jgi:ATP-binding cassette subfamily B protein
MARLVFDHPFLSLASVGLGLVVGVSGWATAFLVRIVLDDTSNPSLLKIVAVSVALVGVLRAVSAVVRRVVQIGVVRRIEGRAAREYLSHVLRLELAHAERYSPADLFHRLKGLEHLRQALEDRMLGVAFDVALVISAAAILAFQSPLLAGLAFLGALLPALVVSRLKRSIKDCFQETQERNASLGSGCLDALQGGMDLKSLGAEGWMEDRLWKRYAESQECRAHHLSKLAVIGNATALLSSLATILILFLGAQEVRSGLITPGQMMFVFTMAGTMLGPLENLVVSWIFFDDAAVALDRTDEVLRLSAEPASAGGKVPMDLRGEIHLEGVSFGYRTECPVLQDITLTIVPGTVVAVVGESGAGKSTLLSLLMGLRRPWSGRVFIDGHDLAGVSSGRIRSRIAVVFQKPYLFEATLEENMCLGCDQFTTEDIWTALRTAGMEEGVRALPGRLLYRLTREGGTFSGGQVQRLALARALVRNPKILLLDEATNNLDVHTEGAIWSALKDGSDRRTTVFVTHRLASSALADKIVVLEKGVIVESGSYDELMSIGGSYFKLWSRQNMSIHRGPAPSVAVKIAIETPSPEHIG